MKPIINPIYFYLISVCGNLQFALVLIGVLGILVAIIGAIAFALMKSEAYNDEEEKYAEKNLKIFIKCFIACIVMCFIACFIPSEETCYKMMVTSIITPDNIAAVGSSAQDITDYIIDSINKATEKETSEGDK